VCALGDCIECIELWPCCESKVLTYIHVGVVCVLWSKSVVVSVNREVTRLVLTAFRSLSSCLRSIFGSDLAWCLPLQIVIGN